MTVTTNADTKFRRSDGSTCSGSDVKAGQTVTVEGWKRTDGTVKAQILTIGEVAAPGRLPPGRQAKAGPVRRLYSRTSPGGPGPR